MNPNNNLDISKQYGNSYRRKYLFARQRIHSGFCDGDWWDMDEYLLDLLPAMLNNMAAKTISYPGTEEFPTLESWQNWLRETANCFISAKQTEEDMLNCDNFSPSVMKEKSDNATAAINEGFSRISKYFYDLWD